MIKSRLLLSMVLFIILIFIFNRFFIKSYSFTNEPIDCVIPCHEKDKVTLDFVIDGIKKNVKDLRRVVIVSSKPLTSKAEWFDEKNFSFSKYDIAFQIFKNETEAKQFINHPETRIGWIFQQFIKIYSVFVIPNISSNLLIVDADTIFLKPVEFLTPEGAGLYNPGTEFHEPYFTHLKRVIPNFKKVYPNYSGISHHMLFQKCVLEEIFTLIKNIHKEDPFKVFCSKIDKAELFDSCMCIDYELYFNYVFSKTEQVKIRHLKWKNTPYLSKLEKYKEDGYDYVSCHEWLREE